MMVPRLTLALMVAISAGAVPPAGPSDHEAPAVSHRQDPKKPPKPPKRPADPKPTGDPILKRRKPPPKPPHRPPQGRDLVLEVADGT